MNPRLLVSLPNWLGDAVLATGILGSLHRLEHPPIVDVCGNSTALAVAGNHPVVARSIHFERRGEHRRPGRFLALARSLRDQRYDAHLVLAPGLSSALFARAIGSPLRAGFAGPARRFFLTHRLVRRRRGSEHLLEEYRKVLDLLGLAAPPIEPEVMVASEAARRAAALLTAHGLGRRGYAVLAPDAAYGLTKRWPAERFAQLGMALAEGHGLAIVLVGASGSAAPAAVRAQMAASAARPERNLAIADLTGETDLPTLAAVLAQSNLVVANDSGPLHLARAVGAPAVGIFGSTDPGWTGPRGGRAVTAVERPPCAPCFRRSCGIGVVCLTRISTDEVIRAAEAALASPPSLASPPARASLTA